MAGRVICCLCCRGMVSELFEGPLHIKNDKAKISPVVLPIIIREANSFPVIHSFNTSFIIQNIDFCYYNLENALTYNLKII